MHYTGESFRVLFLSIYLSESSTYETRAGFHSALFIFARLNRSHPRFAFYI